MLLQVHLRPYSKPHVFLLKVFELKLGLVVAGLGDRHVGSYVASWSGTLRGGSAHAVGSLDEALLRLLAKHHLGTKVNYGGALVSFERLFVSHWRHFLAIEQRLFAFTRVVLDFFCELQLDALVFILSKVRGIGVQGLVLHWLAGMGRRQETLAPHLGDIKGGPPGVSGILESGQHLRLIVLLQLKQDVVTVHLREVLVELVKLRGRSLPRKRFSPKVGCKFRSV